jgi:hypothetical protein
MFKVEAVEKTYTETNSIRDRSNARWRFDMGRLLDINPGVSVEADDDILDSLEDINSLFIEGVDMDAQPGDVHPGKNQAPKNTRRRLEDRLEEIRLLRQITDYGFNLH